MPTGSYLVVRPNLWAHYLNVWFMPSGAEFENTIGLCKNLFIFCYLFYFLYTLDFYVSVGCLKCMILGPDVLCCP